MTDLDRFTAAAIAALIWTETGIDSDIPEGAALARETFADLAADCRSWWRRFGCYVGPAGMDSESAGQAFLLTRNEHGAGFWDGRANETYSETLTAGAHAYGPFVCYLGDDGLLYA